jgi:DNA-binding transcriptional regulator YdaS (Cro superfamily)
MDTTPAPPCDLRTYLKSAGRGAPSAIARALGVHVVMVYQWAAAEKPKAISEDRAPDLERATGFQVLCETSCPLATWVRIPDPAWPHGKPLLDKASASPVIVSLKAQA